MSIGKLLQPNRAPAPHAEEAGQPSRRQLTAAAIAIAFASLPDSACADVLPEDLHTAARSILFLKNAPVGRADLGLVFTERAGQELAQRLGDSLGRQLRVGSLDLDLRPVALANLAGSTARALFLVDPSQMAARALSGFVQRRGILTITSDPSLVNAGLLVMAVRSLPRVTIQVSRVAEQEAGVSFAPAFRMMIQEQ